MTQESFLMERLIGAQKMKQKMKDEEIDNSDVMERIKEMRQKKATQGKRIESK